ncbi:expressed unknown protein [Seminavis robusta]|uniref:Uncharacterized protein n=1 Tax=Seminavis robusta TaxID=568900 RepID=A0A9N8E2Z9_9STRA|nr:expressed unknown protein [Seminavis robusta]|eukprot:Sro597_g172901.1  (171) ;mRNA; f:34592-35104
MRAEVSSELRSTAAMFTCIESKSYPTLGLVWINSSVSITGMSADCKGSPMVEEARLPPALNGVEAGAGAGAGVALPVEEGALYGNLRNPRCSLVKWALVPLENLPQLRQYLATTLPSTEMVCWASSGMFSLGGIEASLSLMRPESLELVSALRPLSFGAPRLGHDGSFLW